MNRASWHFIRSFLAVAHLGSVSAAARSLGVSQPTLSRDIQTLETHVIPDSLHALRQQQVIGFDHDTNFIDGAKIMGYEFSRDDFNLRTDNLLMQISLARQACGIVVTHIGLAKHWPELVRILEWVPIPTLEFWMVCHADMQYNARIRTFKNHLIQWFNDDPYHGFNI